MYKKELLRVWSFDQTRSKNYSNRALLEKIKLKHGRRRSRLIRFSRILDWHLDQDKNNNGKYGQTGYKRRLLEYRKKRNLQEGQSGKDQPDKRFSGDKSGCKQYARIFHTCFLRIVMISFYIHSFYAAFDQAPMNIANVVSSGRYIPTLTSIGLFTCMRMNAAPMSIPTMINGQAISPRTIPCDNKAIKLA